MPIVNFLYCTKTVKPGFISCLILVVTFVRLSTVYAASIAWLVIECRQCLLCVYCRVCYGTPLISSPCHLLMYVRRASLPFLRTSAMFFHFLTNVTPPSVLTSGVVCSSFHRWCYYSNHIGECYHSFCCRLTAIFVGNDRQAASSSGALSVPVIIIVAYRHQRPVATTRDAHDLRQLSRTVLCLSMSRCLSAVTRSCVVVQEVSTIGH